MSSVKSTYYQPARGGYITYDSSSSSEEGDKITEEWREFVDTPDESKGDFRCKICESRMNTLEMWHAHVIGKKHLKNISKGPGEAPSKVKTIKWNDKPLILNDILNSEEAIIGLDYICETRRLDPKVAPFYSCYLCHATCPTLSILDHIVSSKHRMNYFEKRRPQLFDLINGIALSKSVLESVIEDHAHLAQTEDGRGFIEVKMVKPKGISASAFKTSSQRVMPSYCPPKSERLDLRHKLERTNRPKEIKPGSSHEPQYVPEPAVYGPVPPPVSLSTSASATEAASTSGQSTPKQTNNGSATGGNSGLATNVESGLDTNGKKELPNDDSVILIEVEDPDLKLTKLIENATPDQLDEIMKETEKVLETCEVSDELKLELLRQRCRILHWIYMLNYYKELNEELKPVFISRLHDRRACLKELSDD